MDSSQPSGTAGTSPKPQAEWTIREKRPQSQHKRFDPLDVLPEEIWRAIIAESASEMHSRAGMVISQDTLLDLMQVSRCWNIRISSSPTLWVDIILEDEYDVAAKACLALHLSKLAPLTLYMHYPTCWWDTLQEHIVANRARITKVYVLHYHGSRFEGPILRQLSPLPSLTGLYYVRLLYPEPEESFDYLLDSPLAWSNLRLDRGTLERRGIRDFRGIHLQGELQDVFDLLEGSECLQEVTVQTNTSQMDLKLMTPLLGSPLPWKSLTYISSRQSFLRAIIGRLPMLVELRIHASQVTFCFLMPLIYQLENLSIFKVTIRGKWGQFERLVIHQASTSVREAGIDIGGDISPVLEPIVDALFRCLPNIRFLSLDAVDLPTICMLTSSTGFQHLQTLQLKAISTRDTWLNSDSVLKPFAVERASYWIHGALLRPLMSLQSHHIKCLVIYCFTLSQMDMCSQRWAAIRTIELNSNITVDWKGPTYQHLHSISLKRVFMGRAGSNVTKLCRDIALHPQYFPALSKLEFDGCPELDILFILIEGRNIATQLGISPISILRLPTRCPPFLVERLRDLVKGGRHAPLRYYDLSVAGNYDIITDASITGCFDCHRALRFCTEPLNPRGAPFPIPVMEYPETVTEILESWDVRAEKWYPVEDTLRYKRCGRSFPPVSITR